jgi:hypothetical protein
VQADAWPGKQGLEFLGRLEHLCQGRAGRPQALAAVSQRGEMLKTAGIQWFGMLVVIALIACAPARPQPDYSTRVGAPLALTLVGRQPDRGKLSSFPNRNTPPSGASRPARAASPPKPVRPAATVATPPKKAGRTPSRKAGRASDRVSQPDWTRLFKAWEHGCVNSPEFDAFQKKFAFFDRQRGLELGEIKLPDAFKVATGTPTSRYRDDYSSYILPVTSGSYYGIPVKSIEFYTGHENGIRGKQLVLNAPEQGVRAVLKNKKVAFRKGKTGRAVVVSGTARQTSVTCDASD